MDCDAVRTELFGVLRGEKIDAAVEHHIHGCRLCARELDELRDVDRLLTGNVTCAPAGDLEAEVMELAALEAIGRRVAAAPLEHEPPDRLERSALDRAGVLVASGRRGRGGRVLASALAAAALLLAVLAFGWRDRLGQMESRVTNLLQDLGPPGTAVDRAVLTGMPAPAPTAELRGYPQKNFRLVLHADDLPVTRPGYHYEVWLSGPQGRVSCGTFRVETPGHVMFSALVGVDPRSYPKIEVVLEPDDGKPAIAGITRWWGELDL